MAGEAAKRASVDAGAGTKRTGRAPIAIFKIPRIIIKLLVLLTLCALVPFIILVILLAGIIRPVSYPLSVRVSSVLPLVIWSLFHVLFKLSIRVATPLPSVPDGNAILISNHIGAADFIFVNALNEHRFKDAKYAIKHSLRFFPVFYQGCQLVDFLVIHRSFDLDRSRITEYFKRLIRHAIPCWFVIYSEGHRATPERLSESATFCKERGIPPFRHVLCPRYKGFDLLVQSVRNSHFKLLVDMTLYCEGDPPSIGQLLFGGNIHSFKCDVRTVPLENIAEPMQFLMEAFRRKDSLIDEWKGE